MIPLNDLKRETAELAAELTAAAERVVLGGWYVLGPEVEAFEREFATSLNLGDVVGVANGTDALELALRAAGVNPGDEVVTAANAGGYTTAAALALQARVVFADVDATSLTLSAATVALALSARTKAVVVTHLYGYLAEMEPLVAVVRQRAPQALVIEDCAQAHGAQRGGRFAGSFGDLAAFSFYPTKNLGALGDGGAVATANLALAQRVRQLRQYGWGTKYVVETPHGRNSRLDELQAALLRVKLRHLLARNERRREIARQLQTAAPRLNWVHRPEPGFVAHLCVARHPERDAVGRQLRERGVATAVHYPRPDFLQPAWQGAEWRTVDDVSETERACREVFTVPCFPELTPAEVARMAQALAEVVP